MRTVSVNASKNYDVYVKSGILSEVGLFAAKTVCPQKAAIISDEKVYSLYGNVLLESLEKSGFSVSVFKHKSGESAKSLSVYEELVDFLSKSGIKREDALFSLGGGVTSDLCGFAAATYLRGINYFTVPTTLLSMVDASVGGKTALNLSSGKNLIGAFYQPSAVFVDTETLKTLPEEEYNSGCAEIIKCGVLNAEIFALIENCGIKEREEEIIESCIKLKKEIVEKDEFDKSVRKLLNLGHTFAHAEEKCSGYKISHGYAVAVGLAVISSAAKKSGFLKSETAERIIKELEKYNLPVKSQFSKEQLLKAVKFDKKANGNTIDLIMPSDIGKCEVLRIKQSELEKVVFYE